MKKLWSLFRCRPHNRGKVDQARLDRARNLFASHVLHGEVACQLCPQAGTKVRTVIVSEKRVAFYALCEQCERLPDAIARAEASLHAGGKELSVEIGLDDDVSRSSLV